jgi:hypothetical protein
MNSGRKNIIGDLIMSTTIGCAALIGALAILFILFIFFVFAQTLLSNI